VIALLRQIAASLAEAHGRGLIHRDIKPSNVMVRHREENPDCVKVLDFGLAMRVRGADFLLTGASPFAGDDARALARAHLREPPLPPSLRTERGVPPDLEAVLMRCLEKRAEHRYPHGRALLHALAACVEDPSWSPTEADLWWRAWSSDTAAPARVIPSPAPGATRMDLAPLSTRPFALRAR
jgi:serine/threonine-protein kinase